jgi:hypothetical protein
VTGAVRNTVPGLRARWRRLALLALPLLALFPGATSARAQQPPPAYGLSLQVTQHPTTQPDGTLAQEIDVAFSGAYGLHVRLVEDRTTLLFDGFADGAIATVQRRFAPRCGEEHTYDLTAIADGVLVERRTATSVLCPPPTPTPTQPTATAAPAAGAVAAPPPPPPAAAVPSRGAQLPGQPPVPAPPLSPPGLADSSGFVLAAADDYSAAVAIDASVPYLRILAIFLRGNASDGGGDGQYQYVQVGNLGGAAQDLSGWALQGDSGTVAGLTYYFPGGFTLQPGESCRIYVDHPAEATCASGSFALFRFWGDHGDATLWDDQGRLVDELGY